MKMTYYNNIKICTESFGDKENPALLLIMGATSSMIWWETAFCQQLVDNGFFVIRYDNRDTGKSTHYELGKPEYTFEDLADDAIYVLDSYGIKKAIIMGMSMGGMLTQMIAVRYPERVEGIVLLSSMYFAKGAENLPYSSDEVNLFFENLSKTKSPTNTDEMVEIAVKQWQVTSQSKRPHDEEHIRQMTRKDIERADCYESRMNHAVAQVTGDELERISEITLPSLIIHGTEDVVIPYIHGEMLARTISNSEFHIMNGAGHELHTLDYDDVIKAICKRFVH